MKFKKLKKLIIDYQNHINNLATITGIVKNTRFITVRFYSDLSGVIYAEDDYIMPFDTLKELKMILKQKLTGNNESIPNNT